MLEGVQVVAKNLDPDLGADASAGHEDAVFDRLEKAGHIARQVHQLRREVGDDGGLGGPGRPLVAGLELDGGFDHLHRGRVGGGGGAPQLARRRDDGRMGADHLVLPGHDALDLRQGGGGEQDRHEKQGTLLQGRHELAAEPLGMARDGLRQPLVDRPRQTQGDHQADGEQAGREPQHGFAVVEGPVQRRVIEPQQPLHQPILVLGLERTPHQQGAEDRHRRYRQQGGADQGEGLGVGEGVKELALLAGQQEDRDKGQDDDQHGEDQGPADLGGGRQGLGKDLGGGEPPA